jgi:alkylation response protein AidB-like acyl-CoA dehydrogenase
MDYSFRPFLDALDTNWFEDDALLDRLLAHHADPSVWPTRRDELLEWGRLAAGRLCRLAEEAAMPDNAPHLRHYDAYGTRVDEIVLPHATREALAEVEGWHGLGACHGDPCLFYAKAYLYWQNGEAGVACSMACTDGLVRALEALGDVPEHALALKRVRGSTPERVWHGAQFVTEVQGGSDVPANTLRAVPDGGAAYRLHGRKWFCSNVNADYFLVTARPEGGPTEASGVALFLVPAYLEESEPRRNGYTIDRLKDKLGTRELATAEVTFDGALAYPLGPLDRGVANLLRYVLVTSRFACVISAAAFLRRAERIAGAYADFRTAFGRPIGDFPLVRETVAEVARARARALAIVFGLLRGWLSDETRAGEPDAEALDFRVMLSLAKAVLTREATLLVHEAIMVLGGNGIEERFSPLPRLYRDAVIMETWEGPHNVLLTQALRDLARYRTDPHAFVMRVAGPGHDELARELARILERADDPEATLPFALTARSLVHAYGERLLAELNRAPAPAT